jgi:hypothetical protein
MKRRTPRSVSNGIAPALEPCARLAAQPEPGGGDRDGGGLEPRLLEQHRGGAGVDLGVGAAHDAANTDGIALRVADEAVVCSEVRSMSSRVTIRSPGLAARTTKPLPGTLRSSYAWLGRFSSSITAFDASTTLLMGRMPQRRRRSFSHCGDSATVTPVMRAAVKRPHSSGDRISTVTPLEGPAMSTAGSGRVKGNPSGRPGPWPRPRGPSSPDGCG